MIKISLIALFLACLFFFMGVRAFKNWSIKNPNNETNFLNFFNPLWLMKELYGRDNGFAWFILSFFFLLAGLGFLIENFI